MNIGKIKQIVNLVPMDTNAPVIEPVIETPKISLIKETASV